MGRSLDLSFLVDFFTPCTMSEPFIWVLGKVVTLVFSASLSQCGMWNILLNKQARARVITAPVFSDSYTWDRTYIV